MRVALDARCLNTPHLRGMGKALFAVLHEAAAYEDLEFVLLADEPRAPMHVPAGSRAEIRVWETRGHRFHRWEQISLPREARRRGCDVLHCFGTWCPAWQPLPTVVTLHDTLPWQEGRADVFVRRIMPRAYRRAAAVMTISECSRQDIMARWPELTGKLTVIPWGVGGHYLADTFPPLPRELARQGVRPPYFLYFGGAIPRKRLDWAIRVWAQVNRPDVALVACGVEADRREDFRQLVLPERRSRFVCLDFVPETALPSLYAHAAALLYPTLYEGFGFPALEAQATGIPVLLSPAGSLRELTGPLAISLAPDDLEGWVSACRSILDGQRPGEPAGPRWAARFSWAAAAERIVTVYRRAAKE